MWLKPNDCNFVSESRVETNATANASQENNKTSKFRNGGQCNCNTKSHWAHYHRQKSRQTNTDLDQGLDQWFTNRETIS